MESLLESHPPAHSTQRGGECLIQTLVLHFFRLTIFRYTRLDFMIYVFYRIFVLCICVLPYFELYVLDLGNG